MLFIKHFGKSVRCVGNVKVYFNIISILGGGFVY